MGAYSWKKIHRNDATLKIMNMVMEASNERLSEILNGMREFDDLNDYDVVDNNETLEDER